MELRNYLNHVFPGLYLKPSLYHQWEIGIHFELGEGMYQFTDEDKLNLNRFERVYSQALSVFHDLFSDQDEMILVTNVYHRKSYKKRIKPTKVYDRFLKNKKLKYKIRQKTLPFVFDEEEAEESYISQLHLKCKKRDLDYLLLIKATCNEDFPLQPKLGEENGSYYPDVFFINTSKNIIFFIYDDRGCEVIADKKETIMPLYKKYKGWVSEFKRKEIEE
ncbi:DUF3885 domain-containing protein [Halalkalibacter krulwichiae]|uniref:DUF3885 domain-containing protein n=1 Tax=Halalkalibacter krulwichiae TaxID=199441 RepID=A0A1X9MMS5_9BACI|nr:DUF3885 domain-containing protein [Halalkalibacter krulwichiae]ARK32542.1 hypothetical protein BkAM31D_23210 [Halalkalibacter krulwichiae]